jgi:hypothetical protein
MKQYHQHSFKLHGLLLILTIFIISLLPPAYAQNLPALGDNFTGGIAVNGQAHLQMAILSLSDTVEVTGNIYSLFGEKVVLISGLQQVLTTYLKPTELPNGTARDRNAGLKYLGKAVF